MNIFNLNKANKNTIAIWISAITITLIIVTILISIYIQRLNYENELNKIKGYNLELYSKSYNFLTSFQNMLKIFNSEVEFHFNQYKKNIDNKEEFIENINSNLKITASNLGWGYGVGYWFEPYKVDNKKFYGYWAYKDHDSIKITDVYNSEEYNYHNQYWFTFILPFSWDRNSPLLENYYWTDYYIDTLFTNQSMITLGMPIYNDNKTIIGISTIDLFKSDFNILFKSMKISKYVTFIFRKIYSQNTIYTSNEEFINKHKMEINELFSTVSDTTFIQTNLKIGNIEYLVINSNIENQFATTLIIPNELINKPFRAQLPILIGGALLIIILIIIFLNYFYSSANNSYIVNQCLQTYIQKIISLSPIEIITFDQNGNLIDYHKRFQPLIDKYKREAITIEYFMHNIAKISKEILVNEEIKLENFKIYIDDLNAHYLLNSFNINIKKNNTYVLLLIDISTLISKELEIQNLNKDIKTIISNRTNQLEEAMNSLQELNQKLSNKMEDLTRVNSELNKSEMELKSTIATKEKFLSVITHDIKNPLHSIKMIIDLLKNYFKMMSEQEIISYFNKTNNTINSISCLIENVLLWSKSQSNQISFEPEVFNLYDSIDNIIKLSDTNLTQKSINLRIFGNSNIIVKTDKNMLEVIFRNILSNAIKFSKSNSVIDIIIDNNSRVDKVVLAIQDYGIGIDSNTLNMLFYETTNHSGNTANSDKGTGLGMLLCKNFIDIMNEEIYVESYINQGSKFSFTINKNV